MADSPFAVDRARLARALNGEERVIFAVERLIKQAMAQLTDEILLAVADPDGYPLGRVLVAGAGITLDTSTDGELEISASGGGVPNPFEVGTLHASDDVNADDDIVAGGDIRAGGELRGGSLRLDGTPNPSVAVPDYTLPVVINGGTYYLALSSTP